MQLSEIVDRIDSAPNAYSCTIDLADGRSLNGVQYDETIVRRETGRKFAGMLVELDSAALDEPDIPTRNGELLVSRGQDDSWRQSTLCVWEGDVQHTIGVVTGLRPDPR